MDIIHSTNLSFVPASHEDKNNPGVFKKVLFKKEDLPQGHVQMINWALLPPGNSFQKHYHEDMEEIFIIISGTAEIKVNEETATITTGDSVKIPKNSAHEMTNNTDKDVTYLVVGIAGTEDGKTVVV